MRLLHLVVDGLLSDALLLFTVLTLIGLLLAKRSVQQALAGALTVLVSWVVLLIGLYAMLRAMGSLDTLLGALVERSGRGVVSAGLDPVLSVKGLYVHAQAMTVLLAYVINIIWARFSPAKFVFLNPIHVLLATAMLLVLFLRVDASPYLAVLSTGAVVGSAMAWLPYLACKPHELMEDSHGVVLGSFHTGLLAGVAALAPKIGTPGRKGKKDSSTTLDSNDLSTPIMFSGLIISALAFLLALNAGEETATAAMKGLGLLALLPSVGAGSYLIGPLVLGFVFAAGLWIVVKATPYILRGIGDAFSGWKKLLPRTRPAVDALFMLAEAPRDAVMGFLLSLAAGTLGYYLFGWIGMTTVVPGMLVALSAGHLVGGGAAAIIASRRGGQRALWIMAPAHGLVLSLVAGLAMTASVGLSKAKIGVAVELSDLSVVGALWSLILRLFA